MGTMGNFISIIITGLLCSGFVSSILSPSSKQCGIALPQFEVKQEGQHSCWDTLTKPVVDFSKGTGGLILTSPLQWVRVLGSCTTTGLINTGSSLMVVYSETAPTWFLSGGELASLIGGELASYYQLAHIEVIGGSRHSLDSDEYPMEMQMVLFMSKYGTLANAHKNHFGVVVISRYFEKPVDDWEDVANDAYLSDIINNHAPDSPNKDYWSSASPFVPKLIGDMSVYYQYHGHDRMCNHGITWMEMHSAGKISRQLLNTFEGLLQTDQNIIKKKEVIKLDPTKLTLRVTPEFYASYLAYMGKSGAGTRFLTNHIMCLYVFALLGIKGGNIFI